jgi:hypothetical protein
MKPVKMTKFTFKFKQPIDNLGDFISHETVIAKSLGKARSILEDAYSMWDWKGYVVESKEPIELYGAIKEVQLSPSRGHGSDN